MGRDHVFALYPVQASWENSIWLRFKWNTYRLHFVSFCVFNTFLVNILFWMPYQISQIWLYFITLEMEDQVEHNALWDIEFDTV